MLFKQIDGWTYEYFPSGESFSCPDHAAGFVELWAQKRGGRIGPALKDYDWDELKPWWGRMVITDILRDPFDYRYRLFGTHLTDVFETDPTGRKASELMDDTRYEISHDMQFYRFLCDNPAVVHSHGVLYWQDRDHIECDFVEVPLSHDGVTVTNVFSVFSSGSWVRDDGLP
ncbi:MAG: hypothetical protein RIC16_06280 [Rhodospirillales bacterium]